MRPGSAVRHRFGWRALRRGFPLRSGWRVRRAGNGDRGSGTVWMVALIGAVWSVAVMAMVVGGARVARHRADAAADLAALAAAAHAAEGSEHACRLAARVARDSEASLRRCTFRGRVVDVIVIARVGALPRTGRLTATARARAGPVDGGSGSVPDFPAPTVTRRASPR
ncbi:Rv3654c family TadE-like protein [Actinoallomurus sp. NPDC052308]|uniref:Rv3654c family TadE-like protein n=1 Tax=Actinoallomurus sp. NPDC052308 TaxID=3155530 RepID=UPI00343DCAF9